MALVDNTTVVHTNKSFNHIQKLIEDIPKVISGRIRDRYGIHRHFWASIAFSLFSDIKDAFEVKAFGLPDELGNQWDDITEQTKAYSRPATRADLTNSQFRNYKNKDTIGLLSPTEYKKWRGFYSYILKKEIKNGTNFNEAKVLAGKAAWSFIKKQGASTKIDVLGQRDLLILRNTDRLYRSLFPGSLTNSGYRKFNNNQIYIVSRGKLEIGTKIEYAKYVDVQRPIWPVTMELWLGNALSLGRDSIIERLEKGLT